MGSIGDNEAGEAQVGGGRMADHSKWRSRGFQALAIAQEQQRGARRRKESIVEHRAIGASPQRL